MTELLPQPDTQHEPSYLGLMREGVLQHRVEALERLLESCTVCPRDCFNNRLNNDIAACYSGRLPIVSSYTAHFGEEPPLVGTHGAGNIFFDISNANLNTVTRVDLATGDTALIDTYTTERHPVAVRAALNGLDLAVKNRIR